VVTLFTGTPWFLTFCMKIPMFLNMSCQQSCTRRASLICHPCFGLVLMLLFFQETRAAQALSRVDPDSLGDESFGWYTREAVGVVVALWTLLLGIIMCAHFFASRRAVDIFHMYNSRNSVQESAHIVLNFFTSTENDYIGIMVVPLLLGM
jgi:hypothetical protein